MNHRPETTTDPDQLTANFHRSEFACQGGHCCGHSAPVNVALVAALQVLRDNLSAFLGRDTPICVTSGFRCIMQDRQVAVERGVPYDLLSNRRSQHCLGNAADILVYDVDPDVVQSLAEVIREFRAGGIGRYSGSRADVIHLDVRPNGPARWKE
jgi:zinc D-Ala-D-Ala carboxypeptidase